MIFRQLRPVLLLLLLLQLLIQPVTCKGAGSDSPLTTTTGATTTRFRWFCDITRNPVVELTWDATYQAYVVPSYDDATDDYYFNTPPRPSPNSGGSTNNQKENEHGSADSNSTTILNNATIDANGMDGVDGSGGSRRRRLNWQRPSQLLDGDDDDGVSLIHSTTFLRSGNPDFEFQELAISATSLQSAARRRRFSQQQQQINRAELDFANLAQHEPTPPKPPTIQARACHCWNSALWDGAYYCGVSRTHCAVPTTPIGMPGCVDEKKQRRLVRSIWPVLVVWYASVVFCLAFTHTGRNAISCLIASVYPKWNDGVAERLLHHDPHEANHMLLRHYRLMRRRRERRMAAERTRRRRAGIPDEGEVPVVANANPNHNNNTNNDGGLGNNNEGAVGSNDDNENNNNEANNNGTNGNNDENHHTTDATNDQNDDHAGLRRRTPFWRWRERRQQEEEEPLPNLWQLAILPRPPIQLVQPGEPTPTELALKTRIYRSNEQQHNRNSPTQSTETAADALKEEIGSPFVDHSEIDISNADQQSPETKMVSRANMNGDNFDLNEEAVHEEGDGAEELNHNDSNDNLDHSASHGHDSLQEWDDSACTICYATIEDGDRVGALPCTHIFHVECLKGWLARRNVCPLCLHEKVATPRYNGSEEPPASGGSPLLVRGDLRLGNPFDYETNVWNLNPSDNSMVETEDGNGHDGDNNENDRNNNNNAAEEMDGASAGVVEMQTLSHPVPTQLPQSDNTSTNTDPVDPRSRTGMFSIFSRQRGHESESSRPA